MEYESDGSSESQAPSTRDSNDSIGSSVEDSVAEEILSDGDDGNYTNSTWKCMVEDYSADKVLGNKPFTLQEWLVIQEIGIPPGSRLEEYVYMFLGVLLWELFVDTNCYDGRRQFT